MKIKDKERTQANELFGEVEEPTELAKTILNSKPKHILDNDKDDDQIKDVLKKLTEEDREKLKQQLKTATSLSEIDKIETALKNGYI